MILHLTNKNYTRYLLSIKMDYAQSVLNRYLMIQQKNWIMNRLIWYLRENIWKKLLKLIEGQTNSKDLQAMYEMLVNLPKDVVNNVIVNELELNLYLRSVHKNCHKTIDRELNSKEKK